MAHILAHLLIVDECALLSLTQAAVAPFDREREGAVRAREEEVKRAGAMLKTLAENLKAREDAVARGESHGPARCDVLDSNVTLGYTIVMASISSWYEKLLLVECSHLPMRSVPCDPQ
jgi:hypothetical protein